MNAIRGIRTNDPDLPQPKVKGVIRDSQLWAETVERLGGGKAFRIEVPKNYLEHQGITDPVRSFQANLKRYVARNSLKYRIYIREEVIYAVPLNGSK